MDGGDTPGKSIFNFPKNTSSKVDIMFHQSHPTIFRPTFSIVIPNYILVIWIRIFSQISLDKFPCFIICKFEQNVKMVNIPQVYSNRMLCFKFYRFVYHELIFLHGWASYLIGPVQPNYQDINNHPVKLEDKRGKLKTHQQTIVIGMIHIFEIYHHIVFGCHIVCYVMVDY